MLPNLTLWHDFIYIGQTGSLPQRFGNHHKVACFQNKAANYVGVHRDSNERSRLAKEADLLRNRSLPCNG
jgi:hypothetical protein